MLALAPSDHRGQQLDFGPFRHGHNLVHHLVNGLFVYLLAAFWTVGYTDSGI